MTDDLSRINPREHWLAWIGDDPAHDIREQLEQMLAKQVPGSTIERMRVTADPYYLTGGRKTSDGKRVIVTRAAICIAFELVARSPTRGETLTGAFSWAAGGLDGQVRRDRVWLDIGRDFASACEELKLRLYETAAE